YDMDELCEEAKGKEDVLQEVIREIRRSKGRILSVSCFIRSRLKKVKKNELQKTA
ncbi:replication protein, partial [Bacteroides xylanisolvens]